MQTEIRKLNIDKINRELFSNFVRRQEVGDCWRKIDGTWVIKPDPFIDDWSEEDYTFLVSCLKNTIATGGVVYGAFLDGRLKGFCSVEAEPLGSEGQYRDLTSIHVSEEMRGHGTGKKLFRAAADWARAQGAEKLYISAHSCRKRAVRLPDGVSVIEKEGKTMENAKISNLYDLNQTIAKELFEGLTYPWEALAKISDFIKKLGPARDPERYEQRGEDVWVAKSATVAPTAFLNGPLIIDEDAEIRHCAFIRGSAIVGKGSVVGNSTELKNVVIFNSVQVPHYNYVGDSILGYKSHMGAGSITSNVKSDKTLVVVKDKEEKLEAGIKKYGRRLCGGRLQFRLKSGHRHRQPHECLSAFVRARRRSRKFHL